MVKIIPRKIDALETSVSINPQDYALIQEGNRAVCAISMTQGYNGYNQKDTITKVLKEGLEVPRASKFIRHLLNVNQALQRKGFLYDASGNLIEKNRLEKYWETLFHGHWVWSPESFKKGEGHLDLDVITIYGLSENYGLLYKIEPLEKCLEEDCYADLDSANSQGFLTKKAKIQEYKPGKTVWFSYPREHSAVCFGFDVPESGAVFNCNEHPLASGYRLGVFTYIEEA